MTMGETEAYIVANHHFPFDELFGLLREQGFSFGVDTCEMLHYVLMKAIDAGDLERLDQWLCPVVAHSPEQQATFLELYKRLIIPFVEKRSSAGKENQKQVPKPGGAIQSEPTLSPESGSSNTPEAQPFLQEEERIVASLKSRQRSGSPSIERFVAMTEIASELRMVRVVRQLRYTTSSGRQFFDIDKTIRKAAAHAGGMPRPIYAPRLRHIEYLMLIDRHNSRDHQALLYNSIYETLRGNNIFVERFYFDNSPMLCRNERYPGGIALTELLSQYEHAALMMFTDGLQYIDTWEVKRFAWTEMFRHWQHRYFFTPVSPALWGERERLLQELFPFVLPMSVEGMQVVAADLSQGVATECDKLKYWQESVDYTLVPVRIEEKTLDFIGLFFREPVKRWIAACAIYPELNWSLTLALGKMVGEWYPEEHGTQLNSYRQLSQLLRLEWFRLGRIPDRFRRELLDNETWLTRSEVNAVCRFLYEQLSQNIPLEGDSDHAGRSLQLAVYDLLGETDRELAAVKANTVNELLAKSRSLPDIVTLHVINQRDDSPIYFPIPDHLLQRLGVDPDQLRSKRKIPANFVHIRGGRFSMGSPETEVSRSSDETLHEVEVSDFWMCKYVVTIGEYLQFAEETKSHFPQWMEKGNEYNIKTGSNDYYKKLGSALTDDRFPVVGVSWDDAVAYHEWLSKKTGKKFRLPTEAEWEYACRAGKKTPFNTGANLTTDQANYDGNYPYNGNLKGKYRQKTVAVESFEPNKWGLYNMHGNVREWCGDWYSGDYYTECKAKGVVKDPEGPKLESGSSRVLRGGCWNYDAEYCRSAFRYSVTPGSRFSFIGFRLVFVP
jgi:formylglycine-generating enzyme required for sulfatase activity